MVEVDKLLKELIVELELQFQDNFTGLVLFGSYAKGTQTQNSDVDILLTFRKLPKSRLERIELIEILLNKLEKKYKLPINPIIKEKSELELNFLFADIADYAKIIVDKTGEINKFMKEILLKYESGLIKKIISGNNYRIYIENV